MASFSAAMFSGEAINRTENRPVLHVALRAMPDEIYRAGGKNVVPEVHTVLNAMAAFADGVRSGAIKGVAGPFTDVVNIGIGGSDLGPRMAVRALRPWHDGPRMQFVSNVDGADIRDTLSGLKSHDGDPHEGVALRFTNPVTGAPVFPTMDYGAQLLRPGEQTLFKRETSSVLYVVLEGQGETEVAGRTFQWEKNDIFVVPNFLWRRHRNVTKSDAVLYSVSDRALMERIGQYRAQGHDAGGKVVELA